MLRQKTKSKLISASLVAALSISGVLVVPASVSARSVYCTNCATSSQGNRLITQGNSIIDYLGYGNELLNKLIDKVEKTRTDIVNAIGQSTTGVGTAVSQTGEISSNDRAESDQFDKIFDVVISRPKDINCADVGSGSVPPTVTHKGGGGGGGSGGGSYSGAASDKLKIAQAAAGLTDTVLQLKDIPPSDVMDGFIGIGACNDFSSKDSVRGQVCERSGLASGSGKSPYRNADVSGATLLVGPQKSEDKDKMVRRNSFAPNSDEHKAAMANLQMLYSTKAPPVINEKEAKTAAGMTHLGLMTQWFANTDLSKQVAQSRVNSFIVDPDTTTALEEIQKKDGAFLESYLKDFPNWQKGVSLSLMRDIEADRRASNPEWTKRLPSLNEAERAAESLSIQAQQLKMSRDLLEEVSISNLLLAKLLDSNSEKIFEKIEENRVKVINEASFEGSGSTATAQE